MITGWNAARPCSSSAATSRMLRLSAPCPLPSPSCACAPGASIAAAHATIRSLAFICFSQTKAGPHAPPCSSVVSHQSSLEICHRPRLPRQLDDVQACVGAVADVNIAAVVHLDIVRLDLGL